MYSLSDVQCTIQPLYSLSDVQVIEQLIQLMYSLSDVQVIKQLIQLMYSITDVQWTEQPLYCIIDAQCYIITKKVWICRFVTIRVMKIALL